jgi:hypothetical protein
MKILKKNVKLLKLVIENFFNGYKENYYNCNIHIYLIINRQQ